MTLEVRQKRTGRLRSLVRSSVVLIAIVTAAVLLSTTNHVDATPVGAPAAATSSIAPAESNVETLQAAAAGVAVGCALLGLCCLLALAIRVIFRRPPVKAVPRSRLASVAIPTARTRILALNRQQLSISRT